MKFGKAKEALKLSSELSRPKHPKASTKQTVFSFKAQPGVTIIDEIDDFMIQNKEETDNGFVESSTNAMGIRARVEITEATIPDPIMIESTPFVADKYCIICLKQRMTLGDLTMHLLIYHDGLTIRSPLSD